MPRAETWAGVVGLNRATTSSQYSGIDRWFSDASYTVHGAQQAARGARSKGANGDTWCVLYDALANSGLGGAQKMKAHCTVQDIREQKISFHYDFGTGLADVAADVAAMVVQEAPPVLHAVDRFTGLAILMCMRLATIEAHAWTFMSSTSVPRPVQPPLPDILQAETAKAPAAATHVDSGHQLYKFRSGYACRRCQRWRGASKAAYWMRTPCAVARRESATASAAMNRPGPIAGRTPRSDLDDSDGDVLEPGEDDAPFVSFDHVSRAHDASGQEAEAEAAEEMVSLSAAKRLRRSFRSEAGQRIDASAATVSSATQDVVAEVAADLFVPDVAECCRPAMHAETVRWAPPWAHRSHPSHVLLGLGGFVTCARCGSAASRDITKSGLVLPCTRACSNNRGKTLTSLCAGKLPVRHVEWPDGGIDSRNGVRLHRLRFADENG